MLSMTLMQLPPARCTATRANSRHGGKILGVRREDFKAALKRE